LAPFAFWGARLATRRFAAFAFIPLRLSFNSLAGAVSEPFAETFFAE
jgi:hypothetical protein